MIDAIDAGMHARPEDAEQRNITSYRQPLDRTYMQAFKNSIRSEVAKHFAEFFLEAEFNFERIWTPPHRCSDNCCSHSRTQQHRTQTAPTSSCWLALHRLERGGAA